MKNIGVWIDKEKAQLIIVNQDFVAVKTIESGIKDHAETFSRSQGGPSEIIKDRKILERENHQVKVFIKDVVSYLHDAKSLVIVGPAQMGQKLNKVLEDSYPKMASKVKAIKKGNKMTTNQLKAWVKEFFTLN